MEYIKNHIFFLRERINLCTFELSAYVIPIFLALLYLFAFFNAFMQNFNNLNKIYAAFKHCVINVEDKIHRQMREDTKIHLFELFITYGT